MLESSNLSSVRLSPDPPLGQLRASPTEPDISAESRVGNRVRTTTSTLLPDPSWRDTPPLGELVGGQNFKERTLSRCILCSKLCSSGFHRFLSISSLVWRFAEPLYLTDPSEHLSPMIRLKAPSFHFQCRQSFVAFVSGPDPHPGGRSRFLVGCEASHGASVA
jgi:hypothetical protein